MSLFKKQTEIDLLKKNFRQAVLNYRRLCERHDHTCGLNILAHIVPEVARAAQAANELAVRLKELDPEFPASWVLYPTGES